MNLVIENQNNEQRKDFFHDEDIDEDLESLSDDFIDQTNLIKPLSPVQIDEFILPNPSVTNSFSYIFEDLQPLSNDIF